MDPVTALGAAGSVVGIAGFGIQLSQILIKYISQIWSAQESLETIVDEIESTTSALEEIYFFLRQEVVNLKRGRPLYLFSETSLIKVKITADRCLVVFWRVEATISGNWPVGLEDELVRRLTEFNQKLDSYKPGSPIQIETELTSDPLGLRDKLRWASKASKLDKYCKQLQRYQDNLVLLLQVVSLGQQRMKPNPTEEGVRLMLRTYELIKQAATPKELQNIAYEAQIQSQKRRGNPRRDPSVAPSYTTQPRTPSRARGVFTKVPTNPEPSKPSVARSRDISVPQATAMSSILRAKSPSTIISSPTGKTFVYGHDNASHVPTGDRPSSPTFASSSRKPLVRFPNVDGGDGQPKGVLSSLQVDGNSFKASPPPPQVEVYNFVPNGQAADTKASSAMEQRNSPERPSLEAPSHSETGEKHNLWPKSPSPFQPTTTLQDTVHDTAQSLRETHYIQSLENSDAKNLQVAKNKQGQPSDKEIRILPYVLYDRGAYQLPVSLELELKSKLQGTQLTEKLAFLSPDQVQTLQDLLRHNSGDHIRKLTHLEVVKKKPGKKFWQKPIRVMIAFVEGETSSMPAAVSLAIEDPTGTGATRLEQPRNAAVAIPPGAELLSTAQAENTTYPLPQSGRRQNVISQIPLAAPPSIQQLGQAQALDNAGLPGFQDVTPHLVHEEEWREKFTEYRVWTIRPYPSIDRTQPSSGSWDRCVISEEFLNGAEIKRRLNILDKDSMTVLEKTTTLAASQQIQITQSMESAKAGTTDHNDQWKLRQLEIIRAKRFFRPKHVKAIVVYVCRVPLLQAFDHHKNPQKQRLEMDNDPPSFHFNAADEDKYTALSGPTVRRHLASKQTVEYKKRAQSTDSSTSSDEAVSAVYSVASTERNRDRLKDDFEWVRRKSRAVNSKRHEIERANDTIASRPSVPRRRSMSPARRSSTYIRTRTSSPNPIDRYPLTSPRSRSSMNRGSWPPIIINNRIYNSPDSSDESDSSEQDGHRVRHADRQRNVTARRNENDRRRSYERVIEREAPSRLYSPEGRYYERSPISVEGQRKLESEEREREYKVREKAPLDYYVVEDTGGHRRRQSSLSHYSHSVAPRQRSRSVATYRSGPRLLEYYDEEKRREKMENRYPAEFDRQPYDPQLSSQEEDARQEAVEQLLLEWTSCYEATNASDDEDAADAPPCEESGADTVVDDTIMTEPTAQESSATLRDGQSLGAVLIETEEPGTLQYELREVDTVPPPSETRVDAEFTKAAVKQDQGTIANHNPSLRLRTGGYSRTAMSQQPLPRLPRRETTDGNGVREASDRQPLDAGRSQTGTWDDNDDIEIRMLRKGDNIPRVATLPTPARQTWTDANWARQIVEETATVADPDESESSLRRAGTARTVERELLSRERERERARRQRDIERLRRSALRGQIQDETRVGDRNEGSFGQRLGPPPRRRTVEFEAALSERHSTPRERERERSRGAETYIERDYYVSRPREEQESRLRGRDRDRDDEAYIRRDYYG